MIEPPIDNHMARQVTGTEKPHERGRCDNCLRKSKLTQCSWCGKEVCIRCWIMCIGCGRKVCYECERHPRWGMETHDGRCEECGPYEIQENAEILRLAAVAASLGTACQEKITEVIREALAECAGVPVPKRGGDDAT